MKTRISNFLFAALCSVAVTSPLHAQGTAFRDGNPLNGDLTTTRGAEQADPLTGDKAIEHLKRTGLHDSLRAAMTGALWSED